MRESRVRVSIGLPVFNGERYVAAAIECMLAQTWRDFELIISDNASTDGTEAICREFASRDERIRYIRNEENVGAAENFNNVFRLAEGKYFKWCAHDDLCEPEFLERCVEILDANPTVVLCYTQQLDIDENGGKVGHNPYGFRPELPRPHQRFAAMMRFKRGAPAIWGLARADVLRRTPLIAKYYASDLVLLAELTLYGRFHEVPEPLLLHRDHSDRSVYTRTKWTYAAWLDPSNRSSWSLPTWRLFGEYLRCALRAPIGNVERMKCWFFTVKWFRWNWKRAVEDLKRARGQRLATTK